MSPTMDTWTATIIWPWKTSCKSSPWWHDATFTLSLSSCSLCQQQNPGNLICPSSASQPVRELPIVHCIPLTDPDLHSPHNWFGAVCPPKPCWGGGGDQVCLWVWVRVGFSNNTIVFSFHFRFFSLNKNLNICMKDDFWLVKIKALFSFKNPFW